ncbi:hypothetical protein Y032_0181g871 [Ancylostoma ceylanicum]|uniref:Mos1 transposase HTH domain-containing protein n=1 Tax=Ancylostoma ceylanicum TaxID=53326 RepID=A0A016SSR4_9BILA|nr:hypothetical protein Y032_0181g871 [Ancylostoma ceylanicum]
MTAIVAYFVLLAASSTVVTAYLNCGKGAESNCCDKHESCIYGFKSGELATVSSRRINIVFGDGEVTERPAQDWSSRFRAGDFDLNVSSWSGRASGVDSSRLRQLVDSDPRQTMCGRTQALDVYSTTIVDHLRQLGKV